MFKDKIKSQIKFTLNWQATLSDYITGLAWSPSGQFLAASSASDEVGIWRSPSEFQFLLPLSDNAIDCLEFCHDGRFCSVSNKLTHELKRSPVTVRTLHREIYDIQPELDNNYWCFNINMSWISNHLWQLLLAVRYK